MKKCEENPTKTEEAAESEYVHYRGKVPKTISLRLPATEADIQAWYDEMEEWIERTGADEC